MNIRKLIDDNFKDWSLEDTKQIRKLSANEIIKIIQEIDNGGYSEMDVACLCITALQKKESKLLFIKELFRPTTCWNCKIKYKCLIYNATKDDGIIVSSCAEKK